METIDIEEINKKHHISLDNSILEKFAPIPEKVPEWKKEIIKRKNEKLLQDAIDEAIAQKDPYAGVPQWKKELLIKRDNEKAQHKERLSVEQKVKEEVTKKFETKPEWKKDLILKRRISQESPRQMQT
ncbi:espin-like [Clytia hemisphaerica]|uniref:Uncharacterized protein n=1 Tax=Clytia hemisphaerica TaxID=252671 RepID=A0A7M5XEW3_9CNID